LNFIDDVPAAISNPFASTLATSRATRGAAKTSPWIQPQTRHNLDVQIMDHFCKTRLGKKKTKKEKKYPPVNIYHLGKNVT